MKKLLCTGLLLAAICGAFTGCGDDDNNTATNDEGKYYADQNGDINDNIDLNDNAKDKSKIGEVADNAGDAVKDAADGAGDAVSDVAKGAGDAVSDIFDKDETKKK